MAKVYLTGSWSWNMELMTLKAAKVVKEADIIIMIDLQIQNS